MSCAGLWVCLWGVEVGDRIERGLDGFDGGIGVMELERVDIGFGGVDRVILMMSILL